MDVEDLGGTGGTGSQLLEEEVEEGSEEAEGGIGAGAETEWTGTEWTGTEWTGTGWIETGRTERGEDFELFTSFVFGCQFLVKLN